MHYPKRKKKKQSTESLTGNGGGGTCTAPELGQPDFGLEALEPRELLSTVPWGAIPKQIGLDLAVQNYPQYNGANESIAIIDTGVDYMQPVLGASYGPNTIVEAGYNFVDNNSDPFPTDNAHGTGSAALAGANPFDYEGLHYQGISTGCNIIALREETTAQTKESLDWVLANQSKYNIVAVNLIDWGGGDGSSYVTELKRLYKEGVFVGSPSGNAGPTEPAGRPAGSHVVLTGSVNGSDQISSFTQRGPALSMLAPGEDVTLPYYDVTTKQQIIMTGVDGTSWASPLVVGTAALIKQVDPKFTPDQILSIMQDSGVPVTDPATGLVYKRLDVNAALALAIQRATPTPPPTVIPTPTPTPSPTPTPVPDPTSDPSSESTTTEEKKAKRRKHTPPPPPPPPRKHHSARRRA